jgi:hypothetical protein
MCGVKNEASAWAHFHSRARLENAKQRRASAFSSGGYGRETLKCVAAGEPLREVAPSYGSTLNGQSA